MVSTDPPVTTGPGVTDEPCPNAVDAEKGCIYLGVLSDLTEGPFAAIGQAVTKAQTAFWQRVNDRGGIADRFEVNISEYARDNAFDPETMERLYGEVAPNVLAFAHTLGEPTNDAILGSLRDEGIVSVPISRTSAWEFEDVMVESGAPYCIQAMNALDYWTQEAERSPELVMAVHEPGSYGRDSAAGLKVWADQNEVPFIAVEQSPEFDGGSHEAAVDAIVERDPDVVLLAVHQQELPEIVVSADEAGFDGRFIGMSPVWRAALTEDPSFEVLMERLWVVGPWAGHWADDVPAFAALREALPDVAGNDLYIDGWVRSYPLLAALEQAAADGNLTREGLLAAVRRLESVDYQGALPSDAGNFTGDANEQTDRATTVSVPKAAELSGLRSREELYTGDTAEGFDMSQGPCFETVDLGS